MAEIIMQEEAGTPATPSANKWKIYFKSTGLFIIDDAGVEIGPFVVGVADGDKGDITVSASGATWTIDNSVVTLAKMADMATASLLGRNTAGTGAPEVLSAATVRTLLGLVIGTNVQAWDTDLDTWATKTPPSGTAVGTTDTQTLTNKKVQPRVVAVTSNATPTYNTDNGDIFRISSLAAAITSMVTNKTGTPYDGQEMDWEFLDDGTARAITCGADFVSGPATIPTTTIVNKWLFIKWRWSTSRSKWICMAAGSEQ